MTAEIFKQRIGARSIVTSDLVRRIREMSEGETVTYAEFSEACAYDVEKGTHRSSLESAMRIAQRDFGIVLECVHGVGYQRLPNDRISEHAKRKHHKRLVEDNKRYRLKLESVDDSKLEGNDRHDFYSAQAHLAIREAVASKATEKQIQKASVTQGDPNAFMDVNAIVKALKGLWK